MVVREHEESFSHMNWVQTLNSLRVFGMCWRRLCWTLALEIQDLDQKCMHLLMEINAVMLFPSRGASKYGQDLCICLFKSKQQPLFFWLGSVLKFFGKGDITINCTTKTIIWAHSTGVRLIQDRFDTHQCLSRRVLSQVWSDGTSCVCWQGQTEAHSRWQMTQGLLYSILLNQILPGDCRCHSKNV